MRTNKEILKSIEGKLIVSCQALEDEPLHSSYIMGKMAYAAYRGGAAGIRANTIEDIKAIKEMVDLPIIGIIKSVYENSDVYITPTIEEVDQLVSEGVDIIAIDATDRIRPDGKKISEAFPLIRKKYKNQLFMADCSTYEEAIDAAKMGFDLIGTTMHGYTDYTKGAKLPNLDLIKRLSTELDCPVVAEGGIWTIEDLKGVFDNGAFTTVIGSAITRPMNITERFVNAIK